MVIRTLLGPQYQQTVIKTEKALAALSFAEAKQLTSETVMHYREIVAREQQQFQKQFAQKLNQQLRDDE